MFWAPELELPLRHWYPEEPLPLLLSGLQVSKAAMEAWTRCAAAEFANTRMRTTKLDTKVFDFILVTPTSAGHKVH